MADIYNRAELSNVDEAPSFMSRITSPWGVSVFLAIVIGMTFFTSEHNIGMSRNRDNAFVEKIENQENWSSGGNRFRQLSFLSCAGIGILSLVLGRKGRFHVNLPVVVVAFYVLWAGVSYNWSIEPETTARRYVLVLCCVIGCFGYARFLTVADAVRAALLVSVGYLLLGIGAEIYCGAFTPYLGNYRFAGTVHPNIQAANLAMGCIAAYSMARIEPETKKIYYGLFALLFLFLISTKCRSATGVVPVCLGIVWFTAQPARKIFVGLMLATWLVSSVILLCIITDFNPITANQEVLLMGRGEETGSSLTGRLPLWEDLAVYVSRSPMKGYGYGAFWTPKHIYEIAVSQEWVISEAHSSYVEAALHLGIVGVSLLVGSILTTLFHAIYTFRKTARPEYLFLVGGVFFCLIRGFTESGLTAPATVSAFLFVALAAHSWNAPQKLIDTPKSVNDDLNLSQ